jgi:HlyD family secretion protein
MKTKTSSTNTDRDNQLHPEQSPKESDRNNLPVPRPPKKRWNLFILALFILAPGMAIATGWYVVSQAGGSSKPAESEVKTAEKPIKMIGALGRIEPEGEVLKVAPPSTLGSSRIVKLLVKEGDTVKANQVIAQLDGYERTIATVKQAESQVAVRRSQVAQIKAGGKSSDVAAQRANTQSLQANLDRQTNELAVAEKDLSRYEKLLTDGATSEIVRDGFALKVKTLKGQISQTEKQILQASSLTNSVAEVKPTDVLVAEAQLQSAIADLEKAKIELLYTEVRAPIAGEILKVIAKAGEAVSGATGVVEMGNTKQMYAVAEVYETDISRIKPGQNATISSEVLNGEITGKVDRISLRIAKNDVLGTDPATRTDVRVVEVKIRLDESKKMAGYTNMQVKVRIDVGEKT